MKNFNRLIFLALFILVGFYLGFSPYKIQAPYSDSPHFISLFGNLGNRDRLLVLFVLILVSLPTLFLPSIIVLLSFFCRYKFKRRIRLMFIIIFLLSLFVSIFLFVLTRFVHFYKPQFTYHFWLIHIWNFSGVLWTLLLAISFKRRIPLIHWPFDDREDEN